MLFNKFSFALVAGLVAVGEASHNHLNLLHPKRANYNSTTVATSSVAVAPAALSTGVSDPAAPSAVGSASSGSDDVTLTYTLGAGTSTTVVTTTIHRTATDTHYVTAVSIPYTRYDIIHLILQS
jgi:hypothetical protein